MAKQVRKRSTSLKQQVRAADSFHFDVMPEARLKEDQ
jgi:hypothetical protein